MCEPQLGFIGPRFACGLFLTWHKDPMKSTIILKRGKFLTWWFSFPQVFFLSLNICVTSNETFLVWGVIFLFAVQTLTWHPEPPCLLRRCPLVDMIEFHSCRKHAHLYLISSPSSLIYEGDGRTFTPSPAPPGTRLVEEGKRRISFGLMLCCELEPWDHRNYLHFPHHHQFAQC